LLFVNKIFLFPLDCPFFENLSNEKSEAGLKAEYHKVVDLNVVKSCFKSIVAAEFIAIVEYQIGKKWEVSEEK